MRETKRYRALPVAAAACVLGLAGPLTARTQDSALAEGLVSYGGMERASARELATHLDEVFARHAKKKSASALWRAVKRAMSGAAAPASASDGSQATATERMQAGPDLQLLKAIFAQTDTAPVACIQWLELIPERCDPLITAAEQVPEPGASEDASATRDAGTGTGKDAGVAAGDGGNSEVMRFKLDDTATTPETGTSASAKSDDEDDSEDGGRTGTTDSRAASTRDGAGSASDNTDSQSASARDVSNPSTSKAAKLRKQAEQHFQAGRHVQAAVAYEAAIGLDGNNAALYAGLGDARSKMGNKTGAAQAYRTAVRLAPENSEYYLALGKALLEVGDRQGAIAAFRHALRIDPATSQAREQLASLGADVPAGADQDEGKRAQGGLPYKPSRSAIVAAMRPLERAVEACKPGHKGRVVFRIVIEGKTGTVQKVRLKGPLAEQAKGGCMESVIHSASFPRFRKDTLEIEYPFVL